MLKKTGLCSNMVEICNSDDKYIVCVGIDIFSKINNNICLMYNHNRCIIIIIVRHHKHIHVCLFSLPIFWKTFLYMYILYIYATFTTDISNHHCSIINYFRATIRQKQLYIHLILYKFASLLLNIIA